MKSLRTPPSKHHQDQEEEEGAILWGTAATSTNRGGLNKEVKDKKDKKRRKEEEAKESVEDKERGFKELGLDSALVQMCSEMGFKRPTQIQCKAIPLILRGWLSISVCVCGRLTPIAITTTTGKDVVGRAKTGSGKTAAFALPIIQQLAKDPFGIFSLVLTPTRLDSLVLAVSLDAETGRGGERELAVQIADQFRAFGAGVGIKVAVVVGGMGEISNKRKRRAKLWT